MNFKQLATANSWSIKLISAFIGYSIAGPIGILFGLFIATFFLRRLLKYYANPLWVYFKENNVLLKKVFFEATFSVMGYLSKADGRITEQELNRARLLMSQFQLNKEQKMRAMALFNEGKKPHFNLTGQILELQKIGKYNPKLLILFMDILYQTAKIDGLSTRKIQVLDLIFQLLGFMPFHKQYRFYEEFGTTNTEEQQKYSSSNSYSSYSSSSYQPTRSNLDYAYALMEVSPNASKEEIKRAYKRLLSRHHPDKLIAKQVSEERIKVANEKTQKIVKAYKLICESKGW
jgi:DnaJ like chaperone protein